MKTVLFDTTTMSPWADVHRLLSNAKSLTVKVDGLRYKGRAELEDDNGHLMLTFPPRRRPKAKK